jgi:hypothetical protein
LGNNAKHFNIKFKRPRNVDLNENTHKTNSSQSLFMSFLLVCNAAIHKVLWNAHSNGALVLLNCKYAFWAERLLGIEKIEFGHSNLLNSNTMWRVHPMKSQELLPFSYLVMTFLVRECYGSPKKHENSLKFVKIRVE